MYPLSAISNISWLLPLSSLAFFIPINPSASRASRSPIYHDSPIYSQTSCPYSPAHLKHHTQPFCHIFFRRLPPFFLAPARPRITFLLFFYRCYPGPVVSVATVAPDSAFSVQLFISFIASAMPNAQSLLKFYFSPFPPDPLFIFLFGFLPYASRSSPRLMDWCEECMCMQ